MSDGLGVEKEPATPVAKTDPLSPGTGPASDSGEDDGIPGNPVGQLQVRCGSSSFASDESRWFAGIDFLERFRRPKTT